METFFLQTERLRLRPFSQTDVEFMIQLNSDPEVVRYTGDHAFQNQEEAKQVISYLIAQFQTQKMGRFVVLDRHSEEQLGWCGLKWHEDEQVADLGYRFFRKYWRKGFASESAQASLLYGFKQLFLPKIVAHAQIENRASIRVLEKLGFKSTGPTQCNGLNAEGFVVFPHE